MSERNSARLRGVPAHEVTAELVRITPQLAQEWLRSNDNNRAMRQTVVGRLSDAARRGEWMLNGETIKFDWNGNVLDGQHRLAMIVETGITLEIFVIRGLDPRSQETVDRGIRRTLGDMLRLRGEAYAMELSAGLNTFHRIQQGTLKWGAFGGRYYPTIQQAMGHLEQNPRIREGLTIASRIGHILRISTGITIAHRYTFALIKEPDAIYFFEKLLTGSNLPDDDPILVFRNVMLQDAQRVQGRRYQRHEQAALMVKAWNHYRRGEKIEGLTYRGGGTTPEGWPEPI